MEYVSITEIISQLDGSIFGPLGIKTNGTSMVSVCIGIGSLYLMSDYKYSKVTPIHKVLLYFKKSKPLVNKCLLLTKKCDFSLNFN